MAPPVRRRMARGAGVCAATVCRLRTRREGRGRMPAGGQHEQGGKETEGGNASHDGTLYPFAPRGGAGRARTAPQAKP